MIRKIPSEPSEPSATDNSCSNLTKIADGIADGILDVHKVSSANIDQNHAQNKNADDMDDADDIMQTFILPFWRGA